MSMLAPDVSALELELLGLAAGCLFGLLSKGSECPPREFISTGFQVCKVFRAASAALSSASATCRIAS
jgi:hypothetical protein